MSVDDRFIKSLGKQIDKIRLEKGLSFQEMALACEMEKAQVYRLCNGGINVTVQTLLKVAKGLKVTIPDLFDFKH